MKAYKLLNAYQYYFYEQFIVSVQTRFKNDVANDK